MFLIKKHILPKNKFLKRKLVGKRKQYKTAPHMHYEPGNNDSPTNYVDHNASSLAHLLWSHPTNTDRHPSRIMWTYFHINLYHSSGLLGLKLRLGSRPDMSTKPIVPKPTPRSSGASGVGPQICKILSWPFHSRMDES